MKKRTFTILGTSIVILFISILTGCSGKRTLDFEQISECEFTGLNGNGNLSIEINDDIYDDEDFLDKLFPDSSTRKAKEKLSELMETVYYTFSEKELSNDDEITITVNYDEELFEDKEVKVKNPEFTVKVEGLSDGTKIDVFDGLEVTYEGLSGKGYAIFDTSNCSDFVQNYVTFGYSESNLANGDKIKVTASYSEENANNELVIVENDTKEFSVAGLQEPIEIDPFEKLEITYTGASPYLTISIDSTKCDSIVNQYIQFNTEDKYLRNGDTFTVSAVYNEYDAEEYGFVVKTDSKTYTVENQPEYVTSLDGLDLKDLQAEIDDKLAVVTAEYESIKSKNLKSKYLISLKTHFEDKYNASGGVTKYNRYLQIYEYDVMDGYNIEDQEIRYVKYILVYVNNIQKNLDGTISWNIELESYTSDKYDDLISDYITSEKEYYNVTEIKDKEE